MKIILAHRGTGKKNKENTLSSLKAIKKYTITSNIGFGVEFDINLTSDSKLVLYHDKCIKETEKKITDLTFGELKLLDSEITSLEEVLDEFDETDYILDIEFKEYPENKKNFCDIFIELVEKYKKLNYFTSSFDKSIVKYLREKNIICYQLIDENDYIELKKLNSCIIDPCANNNKCIIHYSNANMLLNNVNGIYTLYDKNYINKMPNLSNILYLITDNVDKTIKLIQDRY